MTPLRGFIILLIVALLSSCSSHYQAPIADRSKTSSGYHRVSRGETVYSIAWTYGLDYRSLARWNGISRSYSIYPGQVLRLKPPVKKKSIAKKSVKPVAKSTAGSKTITRTAKKPSRTTQKKTKTKVASNKVRYWRWPARGKLVRGFSNIDSGKKGIAIAGRPGQPIIAAAAGKVVYSGEGLIRYGKLIIIKHNNTYFSAYAHNRRLLVKEGGFVKQGQKIAEMGRTDTDRTMLHFEIRKDGKSVNPLYYLPKM